MTGASRVASFQRVTLAELIQLLVSALAVAGMVGVAALATRGREARPLDDAAARRLLADEFPGSPIDGLWIALDGRGAVARSGEAALVLARIGDGYVARRIAWTTAQGAEVRDGEVRFRFGEFAAPGARLALPSWPPRGQAA